MRLARRILLAVLLVVVLGVSAVIFLVARDVSRLKPQIEQAFEATTGRELTIGGSIDVRWSLNPALSVESLTLANAPFGTRPEMARIGRAEAQFAVIPLIFARRLELGRITLHDSDLWLETNRAGRGNWDLSAKEVEAGGASETGFSIGIAPEIGVRNSTFAYRDGLSGEVFEVEIADLSLTPAPEGGAKLGLDLEFNDRPLSSRWTFGSFSALLAGAQVPVTGNIRSATAELDLEGTLSDPLRSQNVDLKLEGTAGRIGDILALFGGNESLASSARMTAHVAGTPKAFTMSNLSARVGSSRLTGALMGGIPSSGPVTLSGELKSNALDLQDLLPPPQETAPGPVFTADPLPLEALRMLEADLKFTASRFVFGNLVFNNFRAPVVLKNGLLTAKPVAASYRGSPVSGTFRLATNGAPEYEWVMKLERWDLAGLMEDFEFPSRIGTAMDLDVSLRGSGQTLNAMAANTSGRVQLVAGPGTLRTGALNYFVPGLGPLLAPFAANADRTKLNCFGSRLDFASGMGRSRAFLLDAKDFSVSGVLEVNLPDETMGLILLPRAKKGGALGYATDLAGRIQIGGSIWSPEIVAKSDEQQVTDLALGILDILTRGKDGAAPSTSTIGTNVCLEALEAPKPSQAAPAPQTEASPQSDAPRQPGGPEDLIRGLRGIFGIPDEN